MNSYTINDNTEEIRHPFQGQSNDLIEDGVDLFCNPSSYQQLINSNPQKAKLINNFASMTPSDDFCEVIKEGLTESSEEKKPKEIKC